MKIIIGILFLCMAAVIMPVSEAGESRSKTLMICYSFSGNTRSVAEMIREKTGGDIYYVERRTPYSSNRTTMEREAKRELESDRYPELAGSPPDMSTYDLILVGGPVWSYTVSTPILSFLSQADFAGKRVAAFTTHAGGLGQYFPHFRDRARNASVQPGIDFHYSRKDRNEISRRLDAWLAGLR